MLHEYITNIVQRNYTLFSPIQNTDLMDSLNILFYLNKHNVPLIIFNIDTIYTRGRQDVIP